MASDTDLFPLGGELAALIRSKDWASTPLGPPETWSPSLRTLLRLILTSRYAMWMGWGPDLLFFYNDTYARETLGKKHPWALGRPAREVWAEVWHELKPRVDQVVTTNEATWDQGLMLFLERNGYVEETYHSFSYSPAPGDSGETAGLFCVVVEETERVIGERRMGLLREFASLLSQTKSSEDVFAAVERCLTAQARDVPFSLTYVFEDGALARRVSQTNVAGTPAFAPERAAVDDAGPWPFGAVLRSGLTSVVDLPASQGWPSGPWDKAPSRAMVVPIVYQGQSHPAGVFIAGLNPHRPVDESLRSFVELVVGQLAAGLSNARAYEEEKKRADALAAIDRAKTAFFSNVSHEFRTPLTLMLGPTEDALGSPERALRGADLETVHRNELRLLKLVNALLDFARIEAGRTQASYEPTDLGGLTADFASSFRSAVERAGLAFDVDCPPGAEPVYVDHDMWEKIVLNLLSNALKFTFEGMIAVSLLRRGDHAVLVVRDTGAGIADSELPRLFERFHRIEGTRARTHEGSGIGLALVHELVRLHGGTIAVESALGRGTTFTIAIPHGTAHLPQDRISAARALPSTSAGAAYVEEALRWTTVVESLTPRPPSSVSRDRIVVADDNADMRDYIARLMRERWEVEAVGDGKAALEAVRRHPPALVLTDVMMPQLDGFGLLRAMRADATLRAVPVILLSARAGEEASAEGLKAGAVDYIVKPFAARNLLNRVTAKLAAAQAAREANAVKENLYRHFMQAPFPIAVFRGREHVVELANRATLLAWGKTDEDVVGRPILLALPELRGQPFVGYLDEVLRSGVTYEGKAEAARLASGPNGALEEQYYSFVYAPLLDAEGRTEGILMSAFDVTAQVRGRQEIERARDEAQELAAQLSSTSQRLRTAQQVASIGIFDWDAVDKKVYWSPELYALMGLAPGAIEATPEAWTARLHDEDRETGWGAFRDAIAARAPTMEVEVRLRQPDGRSRWVRLSSEIQYDAAGAPLRLLGAAVDVQLLKEAAAARARALAEAERTGRAKDEFLATMSHELRTPLNAMLGWAKVLKADRNDARRLEHGLAVIERNAQTQARLISDLLDVSRIISGKLRLTVQKIAVAAVVLAAVDVVRQAADAKGVRLVVDLDPDVGSMLGDPDRLQQIVWNLLSNAVKFTPASGSVTIKAMRHESRVAIDVQDTGAGLAAEHLPLIFERFQQVDSSTTRVHGGLGLGLAIVRHLAEAHGGTVRAVSEGLGKGSTFTVVLPLRAVVVESESTKNDALVEIADGEVAPDGKPLGGASILVVDDDEDSLDLLRVVLEGAGATVAAATNAPRALDMVGETRFDLVVSDVGMPDMDGYTFMRNLRARHAGVPAVALTAYARVEDAEKAHTAGYQKHLAKPVDAAELIAAIGQLLRPGLPS